MSWAPDKNVFKRCASAPPTSMDWMHVTAKVYSFVLLSVGVVLVYMSFTSQPDLGQFWIYFAGLGAFFGLIGLVGLVAKLTRKAPT